MRFDMRYLCYWFYSVLSAFIALTNASPTAPTHFTGTQSINNKESPICLSPGCIHAASTVLKYIDSSVDPCKNFYQFACGRFIKETHIPDDKAYVMSFNIMSDRLMEQMKLLVEEQSKLNEPKPFRSFKKYYSLCMNETAIEIDNLSTIKSIIKDLGGWPVVEGDHWQEDGFDWKNLVYKFRQIGFSPHVLFEFYPGLDTKNTSRRQINFDQVSLGLEREYLLQGLENEVVKAYYDYLVDIAVEFGADKDRARRELKDSLEFETQLAKISLSREDRLNMTALYNPMTFAELQKRIPSIPLVEYANRIIAIPGYAVIPEEGVDVGVPKYMSDLDLILRQTPKRVLANYIIAKCVRNQVHKLNKVLRDRQLEFHKISDGTQAMQSRWRECIEASITGMRLSAGSLYVRKYFNKDVKTKAEELIVDIRNAFKHILQTVDWMDEATRRKALEKLMALQSHVAFPDELLDDKKLEEYYAGLAIDSDNYFKSDLQLEKFKLDKHFKSLREPVLKNDWTTQAYVVSVNAYYSIGENSIMLPAGILQGLFFDGDRPSYMNYGAMGYAIGHEITHGFDDSGRQYDKNGNLEDWWEKQTNQTFVEKTRCIIDQYGNFSAPEVDLNLNGVTTQGENIADNGGVKEAYMAYNAWIERNGEEPKLPGLDYTPKQLFWISMANVWCSKERKEYLSQQILTNEHSPASFRVIGALSNSVDFAKDFNCAIGSKMNPEHKCSVW